MGKEILLWILGLVAVFAIGFFSVMGVKNGAISREKTVEKAMADVRAEEKRRFDLLPNLADCIKKYDEHEYNVIIGAVEARKGGSVSDVEDIKTMIAAVVERYPDLKSQKNYQEFMNELAVTENRIVANRKIYNSEKTRYDTYVVMFPQSWFLSMTNYEIKTFEELTFENTSVDAPRNLFD